MTDNRTTDLLDGLRNVGNLHEFAELFGFDWHDDSDWTWHDVAVKMADDFEQAIAATLGSGTCRNQWQWDSGFCCSECFYTVPFVDKEFRYCPNCRKTVER